MNNIRTTSARSLFCVALLVLAQVSSMAQTPFTSWDTVVDNEYQTGAILWTQSSEEYRAIAYQTFALARLRLDQNLASHERRKRTDIRRALQGSAVIVDADETVRTTVVFRQSWCGEDYPMTHKRGMPGASALKRVPSPRQSISLPMQHEGA